MAEILPKIDQHSVLDIGCGRGYYRTKDYLGLDVSPEVKPDIVGAIESLPFRDGCFEIVLCFGLIEHFEDFGPNILELIRVCTKTVVIIVPKPKTWWQVWLRLRRRPYGEERTLSPEEWWRFLKKFRISRFEICGINCPLPLLHNQRRFGTIEHAIEIGRAHV